MPPSNQPNARNLVDKCNEVMGVPATYVQATPDLMMVKVIDQRGNELLVVKSLKEAGK
jgi:adenine-specific DNA-methyltransferase